MNIFSRFTKPKLLLHICCAGCGVYVSKELQKKFRVSLYFSNPNIYPEEEMYKRAEEAKKIAELYRLGFFLSESSHDDWLKIISGHESEPERGSRCLLCYEMRMRETAEWAKKNNFKYFSTTLTTSPHKDAEAIFKIGEKLEREYGVKFLKEDFKKNDGFKKSSSLSKSLGLYRQSYCGCEYSRCERPFA